jgi:hypothetical protein
MLDSMIPKPGRGKMANDEFPGLLKGACVSKEGKN